MGSNGLWYGYLVGLVLLIILYTRLLLNVDFKEIIQKVKEQIEEEQRLHLEFNITDSSAGSSMRDTQCCDQSLQHSNLGFHSVGSYNLIPEDQEANDVIMLPADVTVAKFLDVDCQRRDMKEPLIEIDDMERSSHYKVDA